MDIQELCFGHEKMQYQMLWPKTKIHVQYHLLHQLVLVHRLQNWWGFLAPIITILIVGTANSIRFGAVILPSGLRPNVSLWHSDKSSIDTIPFYCLLQVSKKGSIVSLFKTKNMRNISLIICFAWFTVALGYFGLIWNVGKLSKHWIWVNR